MGLWQRRGVRWTFLGFFLFLLLLAAGRMGQVYWQSQPRGVRGPYLQMPAANGMTIRWQTEHAEPGRLRYGTAADKLDRQLRGASGRLHELRLTGLKPDTRYFYSVDGAVHSFHTAPSPSSERPLRLWVQGDPGRAIPTTMQGRDAALAWADEHPREGLPPIDLWLTTGDNAYRSGKDREYQQHLFQAYPRLLPTVPYLPVHGNHDARRNVFYKLFTFPTAGEAGGAPSGSEHYFSLDYGQLHLVFLDSQDGDLAKGGEMLQWLQRDLAATRQRWVIALLHHPPYSKGSHDSDNDADSDGRMRQVRENVLPLLERGGVDLALFGHSHAYERSHLIACHYGGSQSFEAGMRLLPGEKGEYLKPLQRLPFGGTIYNVVGSSAYAQGEQLNHPAMAVSLRELGSLMIDITVNRLQAHFISPDGFELDSYTISKMAIENRAGMSCR